MYVLRSIAAAVAFAGALVLAGTPGALAKGHDNGVADGEPSGNPSVGGQTAGQGGNAVSAGQKGGARGEAASAAGRDNNGGKGNSDGDGGPSNDGGPDH